MKCLITVIFAFGLIGLTGCGSSGKGGGGSSVVAQVPNLTGNEGDNNGGGNNNSPNTNNNGDDDKEPNTDSVNKGNSGGGDSTSDPSGSGNDKGGNTNEPDTDNNSGGGDADTPDPNGNGNGGNSDTPDTNEDPKTPNPNGNEDPPTATIRIIPLPTTVPTFKLQGNGVYRFDLRANDGGYETHFLTNSVGFSLLDLENYYDQFKGYEDVSSLDGVYINYATEYSSGDGNWVFLTGGDTIRSLPIGTHRYGGIGNLNYSRNFVRGLNTNDEITFGFGTVELEVNFDTLTGSLDGVTDLNLNAVGNTITGDIEINATDGTFEGRGRMTGISEEPYVNADILGTFHGIGAAGVSGQYFPVGRTFVVGGFIAEKR